MIEFGQGVAGPDFIRWLGDRYLDMAQEFSRDDEAPDDQYWHHPGRVYSDFEGFAGTDDIEVMLSLEEVKSRLSNGPTFIRDLVAHWMYENIDQGAYRPTLDEVRTFIDTVQWLFSARFYMKMDAPESNEEAGTTPS
jgi:hypothetical protein